MIKARLASLALSVSLLAITGLAITGHLQAQGTASLQGIITDPQKGVVPAAKVTLTDKGNGLVHSTLSQPTGQYQFSQLPPGLYTLTVEAPGFSVARVEDLRLLVDTPSTTDVKMELASAVATVNVSAEVEQLNTVDASVGNAFQERQVQSLPIQTRNAVQLLGFQPGVTQNGEVMGARRDQNNITLDGVDINDNQNALSGLNGNNQGGLAVPTSESHRIELRCARHRLQCCAAGAAGLRAGIPRNGGRKRRYRRPLFGRSGFAGDAQRQQRPAWLGIRI